MALRLLLCGGRDYTDGDRRMWREFAEWHRDAQADAIAAASA